MTDAADVTDVASAEPRRPVAPPTPHNPYVVTLVVVDLLLVAIAGCCFVAATAVASESGAGAAAGLQAVTVGSLEWAAFVSVVLLAVHAILWSPPGR